jgi:hypothetical protein
MIDEAAETGELFAARVARLGLLVGVHVTDVDAEGESAAEHLAAMITLVLYAVVDSGDVVRQETLACKNLRAELTDEVHVDLTMTHDNIIIEPSVCLASSVG